ncbi:hypothetical protein [Thermococcus sp.]|uniref:hypothetical protein n=1 Tax=Thermococcus sp. TaxID=35749 RepID=UPI00261E7239|nr:hypothetical protein [Thermococcus sp.]
MKNWKTVVVALFLVGIMAGMVAAVPAKPVAVKHVRPRRTMACLPRPCSRRFRT